MEHVSTLKHLKYMVIGLCLVIWLGLIIDLIFLFQLISQIHMLKL